jgi:hypothetical protein
MTRQLPGPVLSMTLLPLLLLGCGGSSSSPSFTVTGVSWVEENIDPSFWQTAPPNGQTALYDFWIDYTGDIAFDDIQYARVYIYSSGRYWTINRSSAFFNATSKQIGGYGRWFDDANPNLLPIGFLQVEVRLNSGADARYWIDVPAPASTTAGGYTTMHTEDLLSPPPTSAPMVRRATIGAANTLTSSTQTIRIAFSVDDAKVYDGFVWFYDASGNYLGGFFNFRDPTTGSISARLAGSSLHTDGTSNTLTLQATDLQFDTGASFGQIARFGIGLTDGAQYGPQASGNLRRDCRSISAITALTLLP